MLRLLSRAVFRPEAGTTPLGGSEFFLALQQKPTNISVCASLIYFHPTWNQNSSKMFAHTSLQSIEHAVACPLDDLLQSVEKNHPPPGLTHLALLEDVELVLGGVNVGRLREAVAGFVCSEPDR